MSKKQCACCKEIKPTTSYHKDKQKIDGLTAYCKDCRKEKATAFYTKNKEKIIAQTASWKNKNKDKALKHIRDCYYRNIEKRKEYDKQRLQTNPAYFACKESRRRNEKQLRTPKWLSDDDWWMIEQAYELAMIRSKLTGIKWHVDHIIPLKGKKVSGFHVPSNLQVIPATDNIRKSNKYDPSQW